MSWLFSQALVEESSAVICSDGEPWPLLNVMPTPHPFLRNGKTMDTSRPSLFGLTCGLLTADRGEAVLTWCLADSHARTYRSPEVAQDSTGSAADCGRILRGSLAKYDPTTHSLKTAQDSLFSDSTECSLTLPRSGSMRSGTCYQQPILERPMKGNGSGLLPTPTASSMPCEGTVRLMRKQWLEGNYTLAEASAIAGRDVRKSQGKVPEWFPTPTATAYKGWSPNHNRAATDDRIDYTIEREANQSGTPGRLNPMWEEWLMAWPIGWTQLRPLGMDRWQEWLHQHSPCFAKEPAGNGE